MSDNACEIIIIKNERKNSNLFRKDSVVIQDFIYIQSVTRMKYKRL